MSLAIAIPVYNNSLLLNECLISLELQTVKSFDVYIYDDASSDNYLSIISSFSKFSIQYIKHTENLGALANMQFAYNDLKDKYNFVMVMHEDDLMHPQFIEIVINAISLNEKPAFLICNFISFTNILELKDISATKYHQPNIFLINKKELSLLFLQLNPLAFGSVVFNTNVYKTMDFNFNKYEEFADRPFLLNGLSDSSLIALIKDNLYFYRFHGLTDSRWKNLLPQHIFNLLKLYREILVNTNHISIKFFKKYAMLFVFDAFNNLLLTGKKYSFAVYLFKAKTQGFFSFKYALLKNSIINKTGTNLKKLFS